MGETVGNAAKKHIEEVRRVKFSIGGEPNPLKEDLHLAVSRLSAELYTKDVHFLMELIQNAEDNEYLPGVTPTLEFVITTEDITGTGAPTTLFSEEPDSHCGIGYIVPEWVNGRPTISDIHRIYGSHKILPTTTIVLPLRPEKVNAVKQQLFTVHPELLLFLSKITKLSIQENNRDPLGVDIITAIFLSHETNLCIKKDINADSRHVVLSAQEGTDKIVKECKYYMWRQRFPVKPDYRVYERQGLQEWVADFILSSSRETILLNNKWNLGILDCVGYAFSEAFVAAVKSDEAAPISSIIKVFEFLPTTASPYVELDRVRESIRKNLERKGIIPCETFSKQKVFCKPKEAGRIMSSFRDILSRLKKEGVPLDSISSHGKYTCHSALDVDQFYDALGFLGVQCFGYQWCAKCIQDCNLILQASEDIYVELLMFIMNNWRFFSRQIGNVATLKYLDQNGKVAVCSINSAICGEQKIRFGWTSQHHAWLSKWNTEFGCKEIHFLPDATLFDLKKYQNSDILKTLLKTHAGVEVITLSDFVKLVVDSIKRNKSKRLAISFTHFLCCSLSNKFIFSWDISRCSSIPVVDRFGHVNIDRIAVLMPASGSKWAALMSSNPWAKENYVELGEEYAQCHKFAGECSSKEVFHNFMVEYIKAKDIPELCPPDAGFPSASSHLTKEQAFLLLDWISYLRTGNFLVRNKFIESIAGGKWLKTCAGYSSPNQCLLSDEEESFIFAEMGDFLSHIPIIDERFYDYKIGTYNSDLKYLGVKFGLVEAYPMIVNHLMSLADCRNLTKEAAIPLMKLMRYSMEKGILSDENLKVLKEELSLRTKFGYRAACDSILWDSKWDRFSKIADLPFIDDSYYGSAIYSFKDELTMMGVVVGFTKGSNLLTAGMKFPSKPSAKASRYALSMLELIRFLNSEKNQESFATDFIKEMRNQPWLKTNIGFTPPTECFLSDPEWASLLHVLEVSLIDETFYRGRIGLFKEELQLLGVIVNFDDAKNIICSQFRLLSGSSNLSKRDTLSLLNCLKHFKGMENSPVEKSANCPSEEQGWLTCQGYKHPTDSILFEFMNCLSEEKWLRTCHGDKHPTDSILFDSEWGPISEIADLPFIDDAFYGKSIYSYRDELKMMGVVVVLKDGCRFVVEGLKLPEEPSAITAASALSLLECIRIMLARSSNNPLPDGFLTRLKSKWILTRMGFKTPDQCFLFNSEPSSISNKKWGGYLETEDAPFIHEDYYGNDISMYREELKVIGVKVEAGEGCSLLADILSCHTNFSAIRRIYGYLNQFKWKPKSPDKYDRQIWIPDHNGTDGEWVRPRVCVISDANNLFGAWLNALDKHYEEPLLSFFSMVFGIAESPSTHQYLKLWNKWESQSEQQITMHECCSFWKYICNIWYLYGGESRLESITKLPAKTTDDEVRLIDKTDLFIPDDLQLEQLFAEASANPLFVWCPRPCMPTICMSTLYRIYSSLGVRKLSESVEEGVDFSIDYSLLKVVPRTGLIGKGLVRLVLCFFASCSHFPLSMPRHLIAQQLLRLSVFETVEPIMFAEVISEGLLSKARTDVFDGLYKLVRLGYLLDFDLDSIEYLLKMENLAIVTEDEAFITENTQPIVHKRKQDSAEEMSPPIAEQNQMKRTRC
ncbi:hypothetical protein MRB53_023076 [Persea americana]|uniref:Uncharacterized protein n=1 Tax=Persea americana TaxID=3435 RepID=A0ACC2L8Y7_PERAE|nr:hypothetical protein MRB53_023076 [Persea americana]